MGSVRFLLPLLVLIALARLNIFEYDNPSNGKTGAPGEGNCTECHSPANANFSGSLTLTGIPSEVRIGQSYTLTLRTNKTRGNAVTAGIQLVALNQQNNNAGLMSSPTGNSGILTVANRTYFEHKGSPANFYTDSAVIWTVQWTPAGLANNDVVTFYANSLLADGNRNVAGDLQLHRRLSTIVKSGPPPLVVEATLKQITCNGDNNGGITLVVSGGTPPYNYAWSANTPPVQSNLKPGSYTVTITSQDSQQLVRTYTLTEPPLINFSVASTTNINCSSQLNGKATLQVFGGLPPYLVQWADGVTGLTRSDLGVGKYVVTLTDIRGCLKTTQFEIFSAINIDPRAEAIAESSPGRNDGIAYIKPSGGTPPYLVLWQNGSTSDTIKNLSPGFYTVLVADQSGCLVADTVEIKKGTCLLPISANLIHPRCAEDSSGSISLSADGMSGVISYQWSNGSTLCCLKSLSKGPYGVTATDEKGCSYQDSFELFAPPALQAIVISQGAASCDLVADGSLKLGINGGVAPYSYLWSNGAQADSLDRVLPGEYMVTITDAQSCRSDFLFSIPADDKEKPALTNSVLSVELNENGRAWLTDFLSDTLFSDNCSEVKAVIQRDSINCLDLGTLRLPFQATDASGNLLADTLTILVQDRINPTFSLVGQTQFTTCSGIAYPLIVPKDNCGVQSVTRIDGLGPNGIYPVGKTMEKYLIIDRAGNSSEITFDIIIEDPLPTQLNIQQPRCSVDSSGAIAVVPLKDSSNYTVIWNNGFIGFSQSSLPAGFFFITINDSTGCSKFIDIELKQREIFLNIDSIVHPEKDKNDGFIKLKTQGPISPYKLVWYRDGASFAETFDFLSLGNLKAGLYRIELTDAEGCKVSIDSILLGATSAVDPELVNSWGFRQYPNPVNTHLYWQVNPALIFRRVEIISASGQTVYQKNNLLEPGLDLSTLVPGLYFCHWYSNYGRFFTKFIKL